MTFNACAECLGLKLHETSKHWLRQGWSNG